MQQQKYIYPPVTVSGIQALYNTPELDDGYTTPSAQTDRYGLMLDRVVSDVIKLPNNIQEATISPNELSTSTSIYNIINKLHENYIYLYTRSYIYSNKLPTRYMGYYSHDGTGLPFFVEHKELDTAQIPVTAYINIDPDIDNSAPELSGTVNGHLLNELIDGTWVRDNSLIDVTSVKTMGENYHYGFLCSKNTLTIVKMSSNPEHQVVDYGNTTKPTGSKGWVVVDNYNYVQDIPTGKNSIKYNNITRVKCDNKKNIYILDSGNDNPGINNISNESTRATIYRYDVSGIINENIDNTIKKNKRDLTLMIGDMNKKSNNSDILTPKAFTIDSKDNIIIYDESDYAFKVFDSNGNYIDKYSKRNILFSGTAGTEKQYVGVKDIHFDTHNNELYILTEIGYILKLDDKYNLIARTTIDKQDSNQSENITSLDLTGDYFKVNYPGHKNNEEFLRLEFSKNNNNIFYILTTNRLIKRFKSRLTENIGTFNLLDSSIGMLTQPNEFTSIRPKLKFLSILQDANIYTKEYINDENEVSVVIDTDRTYTYDQLYMYMDFIDVKRSTRLQETLINRNNILSFEERENIKSCLSDDSYVVYDISDTNSITHKEYTSDMVYNKIVHKLLANHIKLIEKITYNFTGKYTPTGSLILDELNYLNEKMYRELIKVIDTRYYIGTNEYMTSSIVNRCFSKIYQIQESILRVLQLNITNSWPVRENDTTVEPYLFTNGNMFNDVNGLPYIGYYFTFELVNGNTQPIAGRNVYDGANTDGQPSFDRYLTIKT